MSGLLKFVGYTLEFSLFLVIALIFLIRSVWFQNVAADYVASYYSSELGTEVTVGAVKINGLDYAEIVGLLVRDQKGDTLIYSPNFSGSVGMLSLNSKFAILEAINSENARVKLQKYAGDSVTNIQFLLDYFASEDTVQSKFKIKVNEINLKNIHFTFDNWNIKSIPYGIDYNHLNIRHLTGKINSLRNRNGVTTFNLENIALLEKSGFILEDMSCYFLANDKKIKFENLNILTPHSNVDIKGLSFNYHDYADLSDFLYAVYMKGDIKPSRLNLQDLSYFVPVFKDFKNNIKVEGILDGTVSGFNIKKLYLGISAVTFYSGELDIRGLPDVKEALFYLNIDKLQTSAKEIEKLNYKAFGLDKPIELPDQLQDLGIVKLTGTLDGFLNEFYTNLTTETDLGSAYAYIQGGLDSTNLLSYTGDIGTDHVQIGRIAGTNMVGSLTSELSLKGQGTSLNELEAIIIGHIHNFDLMGYEYEQIDLEGSIFHQKFEGALSVRDPNLDFDFNGTVDLNGKKNFYDFTAGIQKANLDALHLLNRPTASFKGNLTVSRSTGDNLDNFNGSVILRDAEYYENGISYDFDVIEVTSSQDSGYREIVVRSEFADINMEGDFHLQRLDESLYALGNRVFPSLFTYREFEAIPNEDFDLGITIKDLSALTSIFFPELEVSPATSIGINYESSREMLELFASSERIRYGTISLVNLRIDTTQKFSVYDPFYMLDIDMDTLIVGSSMRLQNFSVQTNLYNDNAHTLVSWGSSDSLYWGNLEADIDVKSSSNMLFELHPSDVYFDKIGHWKINKDAFVLMDSTSFKFDNFLATNGSQSLKLLGTVSENHNERLRVMLGQFQMSNLDPFMADTSLHFHGSLTATGYITDAYNDLYFDAYSEISKFRINEYPIGNIVTIAGWNPLDERIEITGDITDDKNQNTLNIEQGYYYIKRDENLDFKVNFKDSDLEFANAFMPEGFSSLQGMLQGTLFVKGSTVEPLLSGKINLNDAGLTVDMLNTSYYANGTVNIEPDMISAYNIPIKDKLGAKGFLNGSFYHQNFGKFSYDFFAGFNDPFLVMNTTYQMNPLYYGNAFATGDIAVAYDDYNLLEIQVNAKSEKGTNITLPLYGSEDVELQDFVSFINTENQEDDYQVDLEGINLNLSMDITEDANIQLVFDDVVGDAMKGKGVGHIDMYIDQFYDFYMFGSYEISEGSYLFTLKDLINKKFKVRKGGMINWYGDPYDADIDITAIYNLKTSLYDIMPENQKESYRQKTDVDCEMHLTQNLFNPILNFGITLPRSDENAKTILRNLVSSEAEMNKQVFSLLLLNKFLPGEYNTTGSSSSGTAAIGNTTSEMLSNQLSNMLSKFSDDFDIGFNYQPGDEVTSQEVALALSTQLLDDRLTIRTNLGVSHQNTGDNNNSLIGDVDVEYKLNPEGNTRVHAFNRSNEYDITQQEATYTQGVGVFYQESFSTFSELICKLKNLFIREEKECNTCNEQCNDLLTEEEKEACKLAKKQRIEECKEARKQ